MGGIDGGLAGQQMLITGIGDDDANRLVLRLIGVRYADGGALLVIKGLFLD